MAVNQNHSENRRGVVVPQGESILKQCSDVELSFPHAPQGSSFFNGTKRGTLFLTSFRVIFVTSHSVSDPLLSFMMPFDLMKNCTIEQPVFGANYIQGTIQAAPDGGWENQATFKLVFRKGGAIHFAQLMMQAASAAAQGVPLGVQNYWISPPGIYVVTGEGTLYTPETSSRVYVYGAPPAGYGAPPPGYGAPPPGYGVPPAGYPAPTAGYGVPPPAYGVPPPAYGVPPPAYGALPPTRGGPPPAYGAPPPAYGAPSSGYEVSPAGMEARSAGHGAAPSGYPSPLPAPRAPPAGSGVGPPNSVAGQTPGNEASPPSTSSMPHSSSKM
ncbi:postacrosomal sheath WW domain-binding protein [Thomomys bottae]